MRTLPAFLLSLAGIAGCAAPPNSNDGEASSAAAQTRADDECEHRIQGRVYLKDGTESKLFGRKDLPLAGVVINLWTPTRDLGHTTTDANGAFDARATTLKDVGTSGTLVWDGVEYALPQGPHLSCGFDDISTYWFETNPQYGTLDLKGKQEVDIGP